MIKNLLLYLFLILSVISNAQPYVPLLESENRWTYVSNLIPVSPPPHLVQFTNCQYPWDAFPRNAILTTGDDTLVHSLTYKELIYNHDFSQCTFGFIREDTTLRKIYFQDIVDSPEVVLYDFSMAVGDTISINFPITIFNPFFLSGVYRLDSITIFNTIGGNRNAFHLNCVSQSSPNTLTWIEGIGNLGDLVYPYSSNRDEGISAFDCDGFPHDFVQFLTCFEHTDKVYFDSCAYHQVVDNPCYNVQDSCNYWDICGDVDEINNSNAIHIFPNPAFETLLVISYELNGTAEEILIYNLLGEIALTAKFAREMNQNNEIDVSRLAPGIYFLQIEYNDKFYRMKFMKE